MKKGSKDLPRFNKKKIPKLNYGIIHSQFTTVDGVSIVMKQIENVMEKNMGIPAKNIFYLTGKSKRADKRIDVENVLAIDNKVNKLMIRNYSKGYGGSKSEKIEIALTIAQMAIENFIKKNNIDVIIAHNTCHPVNFIMSVALSRYYRDTIKKKKKTPKYILWWHDSHLERVKFRNPSYDVEQYLLQGVPGPYVEYVMFINSLQSQTADEYFTKVEKKRKGFLEQMHLNQDVMYNTTDSLIDTFKDLRSEENSQRVERFIKDFRIRNLLANKKIKLKDVLFCLQHTRLVRRKRIDFALKYCFEIFRKSKYKMFYFLVSGHSTSDDPKVKKNLIKLHQELCKKYDTKDFILAFAEDHDDVTDIKFAEYPRIFARLNGISTYFSEIEGFGNNLLEVLASGLIPIVYTYPVFKKDIAKHKFKIITLDKFNVDQKSISNVLGLLGNEEKKINWANHNLRIIKNKFSHDVIALKLKRAIIRRRMHN